MSKKIQEKTSKHVEAKPLMTLEEAREVLKRHVAVDTEEGSEQIMFYAYNELNDAREDADNYLNEGDGIMPDFERHKMMRKAVKRISDAVELVIAAETNIDLSDF